VLVAGSGPLLLAVAAKLSGLGAKIVGVLEAAHPGRWGRHATAVWGQGDRLAEGWRYLRQLRKERVPYRFGHAVVAAQGAERVEGATVAPLDAAGRPLRERCFDVAIDALCVSFGFVPNVELAQLAGAALVFDPSRGGWAPQVDENLESTAPGLYVAGETAGVGGAASALLTGRMAGLAAAHRLGVLSRDDLERERARFAGRRKRETRFAGVLNAVCAPPAGLAEITTDETIVCRCEEVTAGEVRAAARECAGAVTLDALKVWTRIGQGPCQGRMCGPIVGRLIAAEAGCSPEAIGAFGVRPPARPLPLGALAALQHFEGER
jgi:NADPH-dependent 2,4-dienoyl-CoA reductase/sulfur reductase-like enzyme